MSEENSINYSFEEFRDIYESYKKKDLSSSNQILENIINELDNKNNQLLKKRKKKRHGNSYYNDRDNKQKSGHRHQNNTSTNGWKRKAELQNNDVSSKDDIKKKINLILNSVIDTNTDNVCKKIIKMFEGVKTEDKDEIILHLTDNILNNAIMQSLYSSSYVKIIKTLSDSISKEITANIVTKCNNCSSELEANNLSKQACKGYGGLYTYLYIEKLITFTQLRKYFTEIVRILKDTLTTTVQDGCCEIIVNSFKIILESGLNNSSWKTFVKKYIIPLIEDDSKISMRVKIRLMDIKDKL